MFINIIDIIVLFLLQIYRFHNTYLTRTVLLIEHHIYHENSIVSTAYILYDVLLQHIACINLRYRLTTLLLKFNTNRHPGDIHYTAMLPIS